MGGRLVGVWDVDVWMDPWRCSTILQSAPNCHHDDDADSLSWLEGLEVGGATSKALYIIDFKYFIYSIYSIYYISTYILYIIMMLILSHG